MSRRYLMSSLLLLSLFLNLNAQQPTKQPSPPPTPQPTANAAQQPKESDENQDVVRITTNGRRRVTTR
jgi:hypothetical protein